MATGCNPEIEGRFRDSGEREWFIYTLTDPRTLEVRYVGWTFNLKRRLITHKSSALRFKRHRDCWFKQVLDCGFVPIIEQIESGRGDWASAERKWIAHHRKLGARLTNLTDGGEGVVGYKPKPESVEAMRQKKIGTKWSDAQRAAFTKSSVGRKCSDETRLKISNANTGKKRTLEHREKLSRALSGRVGRPVSEGQKIKMMRGLKAYHAANPDKPRGRFREDIAGQKFGRLTALQFAEKRHGKARWTCSCSCGGSVVVFADCLKRNVTKSCGCLGVDSLRSRNRFNLLRNHKFMPSNCSLSFVMESAMASNSEPLEENEATAPKPADKVN